MKAKNGTVEALNQELPMEPLLASNSYPGEQKTHPAYLFTADLGVERDNVDSVPRP